MSKNAKNATEIATPEIATPEIATETVKTVMVHGQKIELTRQFVNPFAEKEKKKATGVIATIAALVENSGDVGMTKGQVLEVLANVFPERSVKAMASTVNVQLPTRLAADKKFTFTTILNEAGEKVYKFAGSIDNKE